MVFGSFACCFFCLLLVCWVVFAGFRLVFLATGLPVLLVIMVWCAVFVVGDWFSPAFCFFCSLGWFFLAFFLAFASLQ